MELTFAWFWGIKLLAFIMTGIAAYKVIIQHKFENKIWNGVATALLILAIVSPIKLDGTGSTQYKSNQTYNIKQSKELPPKTESKKWQKIHVDGITEEDLK